MIKSIQLLYGILLGGIETEIRPLQVLLVFFKWRHDISSLQYNIKSAANTLAQGEFTVHGWRQPLNQSAPARWP
jgi:hypothetical protein